MSEFSDSYWSQIGPIWDAYTKHKISMSLRERLLKPLRDQLHKEMQDGSVRSGNRHSKSAQEEGRY